MADQLLETSIGEIRAEPNPLPARANVPLTLTWQSTIPEASVRVSEDGATENLVASKSKGSLEIAWIQAGRVYTFRLHGSPPDYPVLGEVVVSRRLEGKLSLTGEDSANGKVIVSWEITAPATAEVFLVEEGAEEELVCRGVTGYFEVSGIKAEIDYTFRLYSSGNQRLLLDEQTFFHSAQGHLMVDATNYRGDEEVTLRWEVTPSATAEVALSENGSEERLVCRGPTGEFIVAGIKPATNNIFRLYATGKRRRLLDETIFFQPAEGRIHANPNPVTLESGSRTTLGWETNCPGGAEVCISENDGEETLVCRGKNGSYEVQGLRSGATYHFRLYAMGETRTLLDEVAVSLHPIPWSILLDRITSSRDGDEFSTELAEFVGTLLSRGIRRPEYPEWFRLWEAQDIHVTPVHYYEPLPDSRTLEDSIWTKDRSLPGVDLNPASQERLLRVACPPFSEEYNAIPIEPTLDTHGFYLRNGRFEGLDAMLAYCLVRHFQPRRIIEVGAGFSTLIMARAALRNGATELHSIEPFPDKFLSRGIPGLTSLQVSQVEEIEPSYFSCLDAGDFLFIDTSHVVRIGGDVNYLFLEVLPLLNPGVIVHVHDIFLPFEYPQDWILKKRRFWTEQYLLQAFLIHNSEYEVLISSGYLSHHFPEEVKKIFPIAAPWGGGSFWMKRKDKI